MSEIRTVADLRRNNLGWREVLEERQNYEHKRWKREQAQAKAREAEVKQQAPANWDAWYAAVDARIVQCLEQHFFNGEGKGVGGAVLGAIGEAMGEIRAQVRDEFKSALKERQRSFEAKLAALEERQAADTRIEASLARARDDLIEATGGAQAQLREEVKRALEELAGAWGKEIAALERRLKAVPGKLPVAKIWRAESVTYEAQVVCHDGSLWQARKDTAQAPGGSDWVCIARAGRDGQPLNFCGAFNGHKTYRALDIVEFHGSSFIACRDSPGIPGCDDAWQLFAREGDRGPVGEIGPRGRKGERGARGEATPTITSWTIDHAHYRAVPTLSNGTQGAVLELRALFERFCAEAVGPAIDAVVTAALKDTA